MKRLKMRTVFIVTALLLGWVVSFYDSALACFIALVCAIGQLEKDVEEEFQITTQLKNGTEKLVIKLGEDKNSHYVNDVEDLLGNVRLIQCCQLSHFQLINNLVTENKAEVRSIQLL